MSIDSITRQIETVSREISSLEKKLADQHKDESGKVDKIARVERSVTKNTSQASLRSKMSEIARCKSDIQAIKKKQAALSKMIADKSKKRRELQVTLLKEQKREQNKFQRDQKTQMDRNMRDIKSRLADSRAANDGEHEDSTMASEKQYDCFISHATEDKHEFVRPLAEALRNRGVAVWFDAFELMVGDSLRRKIDHGLAMSRYGIVVFSESFIRKEWTARELDGLVAKETSSRLNVIIPIWHKVSKEQMLSYSPTIADKLALNTSISSVAEIVDQILALIHRDRTSA